MMVKVVFNDGILDGSPSGLHLRVIFVQLLLDTDWLVFVDGRHKTIDCYEGWAGSGLAADWTSESEKQEQIHVQKRSASMYIYVCKWLVITLETTTPNKTSPFFPLLDSK